MIQSFFKKKLRYAKSTNTTINSFSVGDFNDPNSVEIIKGLNPDLIVFTGGGIVRSALLAIPSIGILNCHMGILPKYRGSFPFVWAILKNDIKNIGCTVHLMDAGIDTGPIYKKYFLEKIPKSIDGIQNVLEKKISCYLLDAVFQIAKGKVSFSAQQTYIGVQYYIPHKSIRAAAEEKINKL